MSTFAGALHSAVRAIEGRQPTVRKQIEAAVRRSLAHASSRACLNAAYRQLSFAQKNGFRARFADIFRTTPAPRRSAAWTIDFAGRRLHVPLRAASFDLDWNTAVCLLGNDVEIKETYEGLLASSLRPELFVDVGANYGTHTLLFLAHGIDTISFEPNVDCHDYCRGLCAANGLEARIEPIALGDRPEIVHLRYPPGQTWLGSTDRDVAQQLERRHRESLATRTVEQRTLDDYSLEFRDRRALVKIDTEGNEARVLAGAGRVLRQHRPLIVFESWTGGSRRDVCQLLEEARYAVAELPWKPGGRQRSLPPRDFFDHAGTNFIAIPL